MALKHVALLGAELVAAGVALGVGITYCALCWVDLPEPVMQRLFYPSSKPRHSSA